MGINQDWDKSNLQDCLLYDLWYPEKAMLILAGYEYCTMLLRNQTINSCFALDPALKHKSDEDKDAKTSFALMQKNLDRLHRWWPHGQSNDAPHPPTYFIEWALSKRFRPDWLDWAIERGLYKSESEEKINQAEFDAEFDEMIGKGSDNTNNQNDLVELDLLHYWIAKELWDGATEDQACSALASLKKEAILSALDGKGQMSAIEMATGMAAIENEININALIDAGVIPLYSPMTLRPTDDRIGAIVNKSVVLEKLASGEHLKFKKAQAKQVGEETSPPGSVETRSRREQQYEIILAVIAALEFDAQQIPDGGKAKIKAACLTRPRLFTPDSFDHAWKKGLAADLFKLANHDKYSSK